MASTTRKRSKKKEVKKEIKKVVRKSAKKSRPKSDAKTHLSSEDLRQLENLSKDVQIARMSMALEEQSLKNMGLELKLQQINLEKQRHLMQNKSEQFEQRKAKYSEYKKSICTVYGLKEEESLGYNPVTGEIVR